MSKFASLLVFGFGLLVMAVVSIIFAQRYFLPAPPVKVKNKIELPECSLPVLDASLRDEFNRRLELAFTDGGIAGVKQFVESEFVPGRAIRITDAPGRFWIVDRELRRCDGDGVAQVDRPPLVPRVSATLRMDDNDARIETWTRMEKTEPYLINAWLVRER